MAFPQHPRRIRAELRCGKTPGADPFHFGEHGARVSEIIDVRVGDMMLDGVAYVHLRGKGRQRRAVSLWPSTVREIRAWLRVNPHLTSSSLLHFLTTL